MTTEKDFENTSADTVAEDSDDFYGDFSDELPVLRLRKREERRIKAGHTWVFSNEVDTKLTPLKSFEPGELVMIEASNQQQLGVGYINPRSLICARLITRNTKSRIGRRFIAMRLRQALKLRQQLFKEDSYRWVFGEADGLPGLVLDRYGAVVVGQITTAGMESLREDIEAAIRKVLELKAMIWRNSSGVRELEGLPLYNEPAYGVVPEFLEIQEGELRFQVPALTGQKTGWFYDQRANRSRLATYAPGKSVLDLFCYAGGWGIAAAAVGASEVTCVDASADAITQVIVNAKLNNQQDKVSAITGDVFNYLRQARAEERHFDVIIVDPPAFIKKAKDKRAGLEAYQRVFSMAMRVLSKDGILFVCSCSFHLDDSELQGALQRAARHLDRQAQVLELLQQSPDHPAHPMIPQTRYLKGVIARIGATF
ncbi:MAG: class I SAM-dependent rRNA methyltransferase [Xanthomonadales bacterium]|nr:class I SAM-dependent rRNA methyltransferase [Xanthomonadales bacterium]